MVNLEQESFFLLQLHPKEGAPSLPLILQSYWAHTCPRIPSYPDLKLSLDPLQKNVTPVLEFRTPKKAEVDLHTLCINSKQPFLPLYTPRGKHSVCSRAQTLQPDFLGLGPFSATDWLCDICRASS